MEIEKLSRQRVSLFEALNTITDKPIKVSFCNDSEVHLGINGSVKFPAGVKVKIVGGNLSPDRQGYVMILTSDNIEIQIPYEIATDVIVDIVIE